MSKTTYSDRFEKVRKFYDQAYHLHKATFKGSTQFFKAYGEIEKDYASALLKLSENVTDYLSDLRREMPHIQENMREVTGNMERMSQLHFNYGDRLREIGEICREEYLYSKKKKEEFMKLMFQRSEGEHTAAKEKRDRQVLNETEMKICKKLYDSIDSFMEEETSRAQKFKQQLVIYFSVTKKVAQKEVELSSAYALKIAQYELNVKVPDIQKVEDMMVDQYNCYGGDTIQRRNRDVNKEIAVNRQSLRESIVKKQRLVKIEEQYQQIEKIVEGYRETPEDLKYPEVAEKQVGLFDTKLVPDYRRFSNMVSSQAVREMAFAWINQFFREDAEAHSLLKLVKTNLRVREVNLKQANTPKQFILGCYKQKEYAQTVRMMVALSEMYTAQPGSRDLVALLRSKEEPKILENSLHWKVLSVLVDCLLEGAIVVRDGSSILDLESSDILSLVIKFADKQMDIDAGVVVLLFLRKVQRALVVTCSDEPETIEDILSMNIDYGGDHPDTYLCRMDLGHQLINFLTKSMSHFYSENVAFSNLVKISLLVQKAMPKNYFEAIDHMHACVKRAGFYFLTEAEGNERIMQGGVWRAEERLRNLTEVLEELEYDRVWEGWLEPIGGELARLVGVGREVISSKMMKDFMAPMREIVQANLSILVEQEGVDRDGFALRLGICMAHLDAHHPLPLNYYDSFFTVLEKYLATTEKDYDEMLEHFRKTELWIMEDNSQATQNCFDFCSLLYKPFEFLLASLNKLKQGSAQTDFILKFSEFIKAKLNIALKEQIQKYLAFLEKSLATYRSMPPEVVLRPKFRELEKYTKDEVAKDRMTFVEVTRRMFNLLFLKDKLEQIISQFLDPQLYVRINYSIFNVDLVKEQASQPGPFQQLLGSVSQIASTIIASESRLVAMVARVTVYHFMRRLFANLYWQEERGFFSSDAKLSPHTFLSCQQDITLLLDAIAKNLPSQAYDNFSQTFSSHFFKAYRCQLLNPHKFKLPMKREKVLQYLKTDLSFITNQFKQSFLENRLIEANIQQQCRHLYQLIESPTPRLMDLFTDANVGSKDNEEARTCLAVLNLREDDDKAEEFVAKYKKLLK